MTYMYASPNTLVLQHRNLPANFPKDQPTYEQSGWCTMENAAASLQTEVGGSLYVLGQGFGRQDARERRTPTEMAAIFADENQTKFVGKGDRPAVAKLYATLHEKLLSFDERRMRFLVSFADYAVNEVLGLGRAVCIFWMFSLFALLVAILLTVWPNTLVVVMGCWFSSLLSLFFIPSREFRRFQARSFASLLCQTSRIAQSV